MRLAGDQSVDARVGGGDGIARTVIAGLSNATVLFGVIVMGGGALVPVSPVTAGLLGFSGVVGLWLDASSFRSGSTVGSAAPALVRRLLRHLVVAAVLFGPMAILAYRAHSGLAGSTGPIMNATAIVRTDARPMRGGDGIELSVHGHRWQAIVPTKLGGRALQVGDVVEVTGFASALPARNAYLDSRHLAGRIKLRALTLRHHGAFPYRVANGVRTALLRSTRGFSDTERTLFAGFVLGDVRSARAELTDDFRASGLSHLVVVSGQNLAFLLAGVQPLVRRLGSRFRWSAMTLRLLVIIGFVFVARFEPSVLRAAVMATVVVITRAIGRPQHLLRVLCLSVGILLLVDPLLIRSVGFGLSCGAVAGIATLSGPLQKRLDRFGFLKTPLSVTLAAQIGTAPLLLLLLDGIPVISVLANLLALPLAAPVMGWGVLAGLPAGLLGEQASAIVHLPTRLLLDSIATLARWAAGFPLGSITRHNAPILAGVTAAGAAWAALVSPPVKGTARPWSPWLFAAVLSLPTVGVAMDAVRQVRSESTGSLGPAVSWTGMEGSGLVRRVDVVVISHGASPARTLREVRRQRIGAVGLVVVVSGGRPQAEILRALAHRVEVGLILSAPGIGSIPGVRWKQAREQMVVAAGRTQVEVLRLSGRRLDIRISPA